MSKKHPTFQMTTFVDNTNVETFSDGTKVTRNLRCGQWVKLQWLSRRSRYIGTLPSGVVVLDHTSGGNFVRFGQKVQQFKKTQAQKAKKKG